MKFLAFASLLAGLVSAQTASFDPVYKPASGEKIPAGTTYTIVWTAPSDYKSININIRLIGGDNQDGQETLLEIASNVSNADEKYEWAVPADAKILGKKFYGLVLTSAEDQATFQYSSPFVIVGDAIPIASASASGSVSNTTPEPTRRASSTLVTSRSTTSKGTTTAESTTLPQTTSTSISTSTTTSQQTTQTTHVSSSVQTPSATSQSQAPAQKTGSSAAAGQAQPYFILVAWSVAAAFLFL